MKKLHNFSNKFNQSKLLTKQLNSVKGGGAGKGWGNGGIVNEAKNCPPPDAGVWKRNSMS